MWPNDPYPHLLKGGSLEGVTESPGKSQKEGPPVPYKALKGLIKPLEDQGTLE